MRIALALVLAVTAACGDDSAVLDASTDAPVRTGNFRLAWDLTDGEAPLGCTEVGAITVAVRVEPIGGVFGEIDPFSCAAGAATSRALPPGEYDVQIDLVASGSRSLLAEPLRIEGVTIALGETLDLGAVTFEVEPEGALRFQIDAGTAGPNCAGAGADSAELVGVRLELSDAAGTCLPTTFEIGAGSGASGTYEVSCDDDPPFACIEPDQVVTVDPAPSGPRLLRIAGLVGGEVPEPECFTRVSQFTIPGNGHETDLGTLTLQLEPVFGCDPSVGPADAGPGDAGPGDAGPADAGTGDASP